MCRVRLQKCTGTAVAATCQRFLPNSHPRPFPLFPAFSHFLFSSSHPTMPTCRRKRVVLTELSQALLQAAQSSPDKEVYYLHQTGEIFETYECVQPTTPSPFSDRLPPRPQGVCGENVLLQIETVPVRGHRQEWPRLLPGARERTAGGPDNAFQVP